MASPGEKGTGGKWPAKKPTSGKFWPLSRRQKAWGAVGLVVVATGTLLWFGAPKIADVVKRVPKGRPVCPVSPAPVAGLRPADYVILVLEDRGSTFEETVWGQVISRSPDGDEFLVRLLGATGETGAIELAKGKHGFRIGEELEVDARCIWDTMAMPDTGGRGLLFCGFAGEELVGSAPLHLPDLRAGDEVVVIASTLIGSDAHADDLAVKVDGISRTGNIVYGTITSPPSFPMHGFRQWMKIQFSRDCIFDWRRP